MYQPSQAAATEAPMEVESGSGDVIAKLQAKSDELSKVFFGVLTST